jgi:toxin ParE1/3/4
MGSDLIIDFCRHIAYLCDHPEIGRVGRIPGTRELVIPGLPYIVPYRVKSAAIQILGVLHTSQEWPQDLKGK